MFGVTNISVTAVFVLRAYHGQILAVVKGQWNYGISNFKMASH